jgi:single-strand DNA-binding protein
VILCGRLTAEPKPNEARTLAKYTLAVDRSGDGTDFINCVCFNKTAEWAMKYLHKGTKILVEGRIQTGSYKNQEGKNVSTTDVVVDRHEFVEGKNNSMPTGASAADIDAFMPIPEATEESLPFD